MNIIVIFLAVLLGQHVTELFGFSYNLFTDPFDATLLVVNIVTFVCIASVLELLLQILKKTRRQ
ncbi:hypothetical protein ACQEXU_09725 [Vibrio sp. TRT 21S02]|uniref:hypothetical protein n=1 Tax=unclassified Vibrio TaxID=2614977 RepID=UPI00349FB231